MTRHKSPYSQYHSRNIHFALPAPAHFMERYLLFLTAACLNPEFKAVITQKQNQQTVWFLHPGTMLQFRHPCSARTTSSSWSGGEGKMQAQQFFTAALQGWVCWLAYSGFWDANGKGDKWLWSPQRYIRQRLKGVVHLQSTSQSHLQSNYPNPTDKGCWLPM